jgi:hypothetical protein
MQTAFLVCQPRRYDGVLKDRQDYACKDSLQVNLTLVLARARDVLHATLFQIPQSLTAVRVASALPSSRVDPPEWLVLLATVYP